MAEDETQRGVEDEVEEYRGLAQDLGTEYLKMTAGGAGLTTGALAVHATAQKIKDALSPKNPGPTIELPPGTEE